MRDGDAARKALADKNGLIGAARSPAVDDLQSARANFYLLLASLLRKPPTSRLLSDLGELRGDASPLGMAQLALADAARATSAESVGREHFNIFIGVGRGEVLPYASYYLTGFLNERPLAEVRGDMGRLGVERRREVFEPEDHIGSLMEIMAGLLRGDFAQAESEAANAAKEADAFFARHIGRWAPRLMTDIAAAPSANFYRAVANLGHLWLEIEREAMQLPD
jgi:TorA maturation chaperone TorD